LVRKRELAVIRGASKVFSAKGDFAGGQWGDRPFAAINSLALLAKSRDWTFSDVLHALCVQAPVSATNESWQADHASESDHR
jgi:hypothetical protein